jgi:hypothetical protein
MKYGARVLPLSGGRAVVKQTVKSGSGQNARYTIDKDKSNHNKHKESHINLKNDKEVAASIRAALAGRLSSTG